MHGMAEAPRVPEHRRVVAAAGAFPGSCEEGDVDWFLLMVEHELGSSLTRFFQSVTVRISQLDVRHEVGIHGVVDRGHTFRVVFDPDAGVEQGDALWFDLAFDRLTELEVAVVVEGVVVGAQVADLPIADFLEFFRAIADTLK